MVKKIESDEVEPEKADSLCVCVGFQAKCTDKGVKRGPQWSSERNISSGDLWSHMLELSPERL